MYKRIDRVYKEISKSEARQLIYEAKYFPKGIQFPEEIVAYERIDGLLYRMYTIQEDLPHGVKDWDQDMLLIYARSRIPEDLTFS